MAGKNSIEITNLEKTTSLLLEVFKEHDCNLIEPDIVQPVDIFIDRSGEEIRNRTYTFKNNEGTELCLRPDLTVPTCRYYLEKEHPGDEVKYCYSGKIFRLQPDDDERIHPREYIQSGIEHFGGSSNESDEANIISLAVKALNNTGMEDIKILIGDIGVFNSLIDNIEMPYRWRRRLKHHFWRPKLFRETLHRLASNNNFPIERVEKEAINALCSQGGSAILAVEDVLNKYKIPIAGKRTIEEVAARLVEKAADVTEPPLNREKVELIESYLEIEGNPSLVLEKLNKLQGNTSLDLGSFSKAITLFEQRNEIMAKLNLPVEEMYFAAEFGRNLEYYSGFVFQINSKVTNMPIAGGGRYDSLLTSNGAIPSISAVGCAVHTERLNIALEELGK